MSDQLSFYKKLVHVVSQKTKFFTDTALNTNQSTDTAFTYLCPFSNVSEVENHTPLSFSEAVNFLIQAYLFLALDFE